MPDSAIQEIVCCIAYPVAGNPTQFMMQRAFAAAGLDWCCLTLEVAPADLADAIRGIRAFGFRGANLNLPHKVAAVPHLDALSKRAELIGAVNCIHRVDDELVGENTDGQGFVDALREECEIGERRFLVLGAGGAARAIAVELARNGAGQLLIANRSRQQAEELVKLLNEQVGVPAECLAWEEPLEVPESVDVLVNATSVGHMDPDARLPIDVETLRADLLVADIIVNPPTTWLLQVASEQGCATLNGLGMLVNQAIADFRIWTGREPDAAVLREAMEEFLEV